MEERRSGGFRKPRPKEDGGRNSSPEKEGLVDDTQLSPFRGQKIARLRQEATPRGWFGRETREVKRIVAFTAVAKDPA